MIKLYQREECPSCSAIRRYLGARGVQYQLVNVARLGSERAEVLALAGIDKPTVPVLQDGDTVLQGSEQIMPYLHARYAAGPFGQPAYGLTKRLEGRTFSEAIAAVREALGTEGFGVLTEIDVKATLKKKLEVDVRPYVILGACNPTLAHQALTAEPSMGLLLPCNVVVAEDPDGAVVVSAIDPKPMFSVVNQPGVEPIAEDVRDRLIAVLAKL